MGYAFMMGTCVRCRLPFAFNPVKVPVVVIDGVREPLCRPCAEWRAAYRIEHGMEPDPPIQPDAYDPVDERELPY